MTASTAGGRELRPPLLLLQEGHEPGALLGLPGRHRVGDGGEHLHLAEVVPVGPAGALHGEDEAPLRSVRGLHDGPEDPDRAGIRHLEALVRRAASGEDHLDAPLLERLEALEVVQVRGEARLLAADEHRELEEELRALAEVRDRRAGPLAAAGARGRRRVTWSSPPPDPSGRTTSAASEGEREQGAIHRDAPPEVRSRSMRARRAAHSSSTSERSASSAAR